VRAAPVDTCEAAVRGADVIVSATSSEQPVVRGAWLAPGAHVNAIGANYEHRRELDTAAVKAAAFIAVDDPEQARYEATDLVEPVKEGALAWDRVHPLSDVVAGNRQPRVSARDITLYKSLGVAIEDVALAARAYEKAVAQGAGVSLPDLAG
jgi:ornithine cyclodeaminase/alanine dehydrogenase-like protein (mu-crystallin family)